MQVYKNEALNNLVTDGKSHKITVTSWNEVQCAEGNSYDLKSWHLQAVCNMTVNSFKGDSHTSRSLVSHCHRDAIKFLLISPCLLQMSKGPHFKSGAGGGSGLLLEETYY